eukprot:188378-Alexandrium_andersonii.AAC.1
MSASLVGSEMCIRDRANNDPNPCCWQNCAQPEPDVHRQRCDTAAHCRETVSYTHLTLPTICSV